MDNNELVKSRVGKQVKIVIKEEKKAKQSFPNGEWVLQGNVHQVLLDAHGNEKVSNMHLLLTKQELFTYDLSDWSYIKAIPLLEYEIEREDSQINFRPLQEGPGKDHKEHQNMRIFRFPTERDAHKWIVELLEVQREEIARRRRSIESTKPCTSPCEETESLWGSPYSPSMVEEEGERKGRPSTLMVPRMQKMKVSPYFRELLPLKREYMNRDYCTFRPSLDSTTPILFLTTETENESPDRSSNLITNTRSRISMGPIRLLSPIFKKYSRDEEQKERARVSETTFTMTLSPSSSVSDKSRSPIYMKEMKRFFSPGDRQCIQGVRSPLGNFLISPRISKGKWENSPIQEEGSKYRARGATPIQGEMEVKRTQGYSNLSPIPSPLPFIFGGGSLRVNICRNNNSGVEPRVKEVDPEGNNAIYVESSFNEDGNLITLEGEECIEFKDQDRAPKGSCVRIGDIDISSALFGTTTDNTLDEYGGMFTFARQSDPHELNSTTSLHSPTMTDTSNTTNITSRPSTYTKPCLMYIPTTKNAKPLDNPEDLFEQYFPSAQALDLYQVAEGWKAALHHNLSLFYSFNHYLKRSASGWAEDSGIISPEETASHLISTFAIADAQIQTALETKNKDEIELMFETSVWTITDAVLVISDLIVEVINKIEFSVKCSKMSEENTGRESDENNSNSPSWEHSEILCCLLEMANHIIEEVNIFKGELGKFSTKYLKPPHSGFGQIEELKPRIIENVLQVSYGNLTKGLDASFGGDTQVELATISEDLVYMYDLIPLDLQKLDILTSILRDIIAKSQIKHSKKNLLQQYFAKTKMLGIMNNWKAGSQHELQS